MEGKKQQYLTQYNENAAVQKEFATLQEDSAVYKKIGVVLVKQDPDDAKNNVGRRLEMIQGQIKDVDAAISANEGKGEDIRKRILASRLNSFAMCSSFARLLSRVYSLLEGVPCGVLCARYC